MENKKITFLENVKKTKIYQFPDGNLKLVWYRASTTEGFAVLAQYWHSAGINMAYPRRCSER